MDEIEIPRCHYCRRLAPEFQYDIISVCIQCTEELSRGRTWGLYRAPWGDIIVAVTKDPDELADWELLDTGDVTTLWNKSLDMGEQS